VVKLECRNEAIVEQRRRPYSPCEGDAITRAGRPIGGDQGTEPSRLAGRSEQGHFALSHLDQQRNVLALQECEPTLDVGDARAAAHGCGPEGGAFAFEHEACPGQSTDRGEAVAVAIAWSSPLTARTPSIN
jgi:hypothetical protein